MMYSVQSVCDEYGNFPSRSMNSEETIRTYPHFETLPLDLGGWGVAAAPNPLRNPLVLLDIAMGYEDPTRRMLVAVGPLRCQNR